MNAVVKFFVICLLMILQSCATVGEVPEYTEPTGDIEFTWHLVPLGGVFVPVVCVQNEKKCSAQPKTMFDKMMSSSSTQNRKAKNVELHITNSAPDNRSRRDLLALRERHAGSDRDKAPL